MSKYVWISIFTFLSVGCNTPRIIQPAPSNHSITNRQGVTFTGKLVGVEDSWLHLESRSGTRFTVSMENFTPLEQNRIRKNTRKLKTPPVWISVFEGNQTYSKNDRLHSIASRYPITGRVIMRSENGQKRAQLSFYKGHLHGLSSYWNKEGNKEAEVEYNKGLSHGITVHWHGNQNIQSRGFYYEGKLHGTLEEYYADGTRKSRSTWKNGIPVGIREEWHKSGHLARQYKYENGKLWSRLEWNEFGDLLRMERIPSDKL